MDKCVTFNSDDSGEKGSPIVYMAYPGEKVHFTGSVKLNFSDFETPRPAQIKDIDNIYVRTHITVIDLKKLGITNYGDVGHIGLHVEDQPLPAASLMIDGASMHLARYPNIGHFDDVIIISDEKGTSTRNVSRFEKQGTPDERRKFKTRSGKPFEWKQTGDIWLDGALSKAWEWKTNRIEHLAADSTVTMEWEFHNKIGMQAIKMFYFNIFEELDSPEEYFVDREEGLLYAFLPTCVNERSNIRLTQSEEPFIQLNGVDYLSFENIIFEGSRNSGIETIAPSSYNSFTNCEISSCGLNGITIDGYGNELRSCLIQNIGAVGVMLKGGDYETLTPALNLIENCDINNYANVRKIFNPGIAVEGFGQVIRHTEVHKGPHISMRVIGVNHIIEYCDFHEAPREYSDMLGIYIITEKRFFDRGTIVRRCKFHDVNGTWKQSAGVYIDNETNGVVVEENYFHDNVAQEQGWSVMVHGGTDNAIRRNVFVDCSFPFCISTRLNGYAREKFEGVLKAWEEQAQAGMNEAWERAYPELLHYFYDGDKKPSEENRLSYNLQYNEEGIIQNYWNIRTPTTNSFTDNLIYNKDQETFAILPTKPEENYYNRGYYAVNNFRVIDGVIQESLIQSNNHNVTSDPGFKDYKYHDLRVKSGSAIMKKLPHLGADFYHEIGRYSAAGVEE